MRRIVYGMAVSLDGFMEGPHGETDWMSYDASQDPDEYIKPFDTFLMGRKTYQAMRRMGVGANAFKGIKNYVFSNSIGEVAEGFQLVKGDGVAVIDRMKRDDGKDMAVYGGAVLGCSLINAGLLDEVVLSIQSILLGEGNPMFQNIRKRKGMKLVKTKRSTHGVILHYQVENGLPAEAIGKGSARKAQAG